MTRNIPPVLVSHANAVATVVLNRPAKLNAIDDDLTLCLEEALISLDADQHVRVVVIRGAGPSFAAGGDLDEFIADPSRVPVMVERFQNAMRALTAMRKPVVASLHGAVAGGGLGIALACDLAVAAENTRMIFAYSKLGVSCDGGLSYRLPRLVGMRKAFEIALVDAPIGAAEALRLGLVNRVVSGDALEAETSRFAEQLARLDPLAVGKAKTLFSGGWDRTFDQQLDAELAAFKICADRPEFVDRIMAIKSRS